MKLTQKNFLYTAIITSILTILVLGYFVFMLPSLYVDYMTNENYDAIVKQHKGYLKDGSFENVNIKNTNCITIDIPFSKDTFVVTGKAFQITISPTTNEMRALLSDIKNYIKSSMDTFQNSEKGLDKDAFILELEGKVSEWKDVFMKQITFLDSLPFAINTKTDTSSFTYFEESAKVYYLTEDTMIIQAGVRDGENHYTNFIGLTFNNDRIVLSLLPTMTPQMNEIRPIVINSLPMIMAVIILFALIVSYLYSKGIVDPIIKLVRHTEAAKKSGVIAKISIPVKGKDEIADLMLTLNELYEELDHNYKALESKNKELNEKNKRQEVFLRSSSHQLKTPVAAALLLIEGMINRVGKYQDVTTYLPEVKKQLLSMRKIVEDILYLSRCEENLSPEMVTLQILIDKLLDNYQITLVDRGFNVITHYTDNGKVITDSNLLLKILDNLLVNAIVHSKEGATITISTKPGQLEIHNSPAHIEEDLMPNIFEPFVSGNDKDGHGLGLYIVAYYANIVQVKIEISNTKDGVLTKVIFEDTNCCGQV